MSDVLSGATATVPFVVPASFLTPYAAGVQSKNAYGQTMCALVLKSASGVLQALVVTSGGTAINNIDLGQIASTVGAAGGGIYSTATTTLRGTAGGWSLPVGNFANANKSCADGVTAGTIPLTAGHGVMALWFTNNAVMSAVLYRDLIPDHLELNTMNTPLIFSATAIQTAGAGCMTNGAVARDAAGGVLSCQSLIWKGGQADSTSRAPKTTSPSCRRPGTAPVTPIGSKRFPTISLFGTRRVASGKGSSSMAPAT